MSGRLVSAVFESTLPAWLKPYAAAFATFAADDGSRVWPSVKTVARMTGRCERSTHTAAAELRRRGVLIVEAPSGRSRTTRYRLNLSVLAFLGNANQPVLFEDLSFPQPKPAKCSGKQGYPQASTQLTCSRLQGLPEVDCTRSVRDPSVTRTGARAKTKTGTEGR